jgi:DNA-binding NarL/FixJ family response regulator
MRILIATPFPDFTRAISVNLREHFAISQIAEAADGEAALKLTRSGRWDVALLSVRLPGGGGHRFLMKLKEERPDLPVVMLSYDEAAVGVAACLKAGAKGYVRRDTLEKSLVPSVKAALAGEVYGSVEVVRWFRSKDGAAWKSAH